MKNPTAALAVLVLAALALSAAAQNPTGNLSFGALDLSQYAATGRASIEVVYSSPYPLAAFQFDVVAGTGVTLTDVGGGLAGAEGFILMIGSPTPESVLGIGFFGETVPAGTGVLCVLTFTADLGDQICFDDCGGNGATCPGTGFFFEAGALPPGTPTQIGPPDLGFGSCVTIQPPGPPAHPGSGEDFILGTGVNAPPTAGPGQDVKAADGFDILQIQTLSPQGTFDFAPIVIGAEVFAAGSPPVGAVAGLHLAMPTIIVGPTALLHPLQPPAPAGFLLVGRLPVGLAPLSIMIQAAVVSPLAAIGAALSDAHELQMQS